MSDYIGQVIEILRRGHEPNPLTVNNAAAELAQLRASEKYWKDGYNEQNEYYLGRETALCSQIVQLRTRAENAEAALEEAKAVIRELLMGNDIGAEEWIEKYGGQK